MTQKQVIEAIRARLEAQWAALHASVPLQWPSELRDEIVLPFGQVAIKFYGADIVAFGGASNNIQRQEGQVFIYLFDQAGVGTSVLDGLADDAATIFRTWRSGELRFWDAAPADADFDTASGANWFQKDVIASFNFDLTT